MSQIREVFASFPTDFFMKNDRVPLTLVGKVAALVTSIGLGIVLAGRMTTPKKVDLVKTSDSADLYIEPEKADSTVKPGGSENGAEAEVTPEMTRFQKFKANVRACRAFVVARAEAHPRLAAGFIGCIAGLAVWGVKRQLTYFSNANRLGKSLIDQNKSPKDPNETESRKGSNDILTGNDSSTTTTVTETDGKETEGTGDLGLQREAAENRDKILEEMDQFDEKVAEKSQALSPRKSIKKTLVDSGKMPLSQKGSNASHKTHLIALTCLGVALIAVCFESLYRGERSEVRRLGSQVGGTFFNQTRAVADTVSGFFSQIKEFTERGSSPPPAASASSPPPAASASSPPPAASASSPPPAASASSSSLSSPSSSASSSSPPPAASASSPPPAASASSPPPAASASSSSSPPAASASSSASSSSPPPAASASSPPPAASASSSPSSSPPAASPSSPPQRRSYFSNTSASIRQGVQAGDTGAWRSWLPSFPNVSNILKPPSCTSDAAV